MPNEESSPKKIDPDAAIGESKKIYADAGDPGFRFLFPGSPNGEKGGLARDPDQGHLVTIVGRGGTGKSSLALQLATYLLEKEDQIDKKNGTEDQRHAVFYFTLEATPNELSVQATQFDWGERYRSVEETEVDDDKWICRGLHIIAIPSPATDLKALILLVRQTVARRLSRIGRLAAIVIDPLGGVALGAALREELNQLRALATSHSCFLFLLTEDHIFDRHRSIEHFSQSIIHVEHDSRKQPYRWMNIQKSRGQIFRSGYHQIELHKRRGVRVFPSIEALSDFAHEKKRPETSTDEEIFIEVQGVNFPVNVVRASVVFLMGPPGTNKQMIASHFAAQISDASTIYISFKADIDAVSRHVTPRKRVKKLQDLVGDWRGTNKRQEKMKEGDGVASESLIYFLDARSPLLTPEYVLSLVQAAIMRSQPSRAVVWGLRRLNDMPNFSGGRSVQFLEALVTLLQSTNTTTLLVDWPDIDRASTLPIVDLSQYIFLTRVCHTRDEIEAIHRKENEEISAMFGIDDKEKGEIIDARRNLQRQDLDKIWGAANFSTDERSQTGSREHVTMLRIQRTREGFRRSKGVILYKFWDSNGIQMGADPYIEKNFERLWKKAGMQWEKDPGLVH